MMRRRVGRPGLVGTMARTAVIAGTATATSNAINNRSMNKQQQQMAAQQQAEAEQQQQMQEYAQQAAAQQAAAQQAAAQPAAASSDDVVAQLKQLADLKAAGALTDAEFAEAKAKLLGS